MNLLSRILAAVLAALALVGAFFFGIFVLAFAAGIGLIAWLVIWLRIWWIRRTLGRGGYGSSGGGKERPDTGAGQGGRNGEVIDAEYEVVSRGEED